MYLDYEIKSLSARSSPCYHIPFQFGLEVISGFFKYISVHFVHLQEWTRLEKQVKDWYGWIGSRCKKNHDLLLLRNVLYQAVKFFCWNQDLESGRWAGQQGEGVGNLWGHRYGSESTPWKKETDQKGEARRDTKLPVEWSNTRQTIKQVFE